jgi:tetratricopeptide (TPR) repeat protein
MACATQTQQAWAHLVTQEALPPALQSIGLYNLALFYAKTQRAASAEEILHQANTLHPDPFIQSIVLSNLARLYAKELKQTEAKNALDRALIANPGLHLFFKQDIDLAPLLDEN